MAMGFSLIFYLAQLQAMPPLTEFVPHPSYANNSVVQVLPSMTRDLVPANVGYWSSLLPPQSTSAKRGWSWTTFFPAYFTLISPTAFYLPTHVSSSAAQHATEELEDSPSTMSQRAAWTGIVPRQHDRSSLVQESFIIDNGQLTTSQHVLNATSKPAALSLTITFPGTIRNNITKSKFLPASSGASAPQLKTAMNYVSIKLLASKAAEQALYSEAVAIAPNLTLVKALDNAAVLWSDRHHEAQERFIINTRSESMLLRAGLRVNPFAINIHRLPDNCWMVDFPNVKVGVSSQAEEFEAKLNAIRQAVYRAHPLGTLNDVTRTRRQQPAGVQMWSYEIFDHMHRVVAKGYCVNHSNRQKSASTIPAQHGASLQDAAPHGNSSTDDANKLAGAYLQPGDTVVFYPRDIN